jgi:hypothetical protein
VFHFYYILTIALWDVVGEEMITFTEFTAAVDFYVAAGGGFAKVGQFREVFAANH